MTAHTGSWIFPTSSPRKAAVPTLCTSRPGLMDTNVSDSLRTGPKLTRGLSYAGLRRHRWRRHLGPDGGNAALEDGRHPPVPRSEELHQRGDQDHAHQGDVDGHGDRETE